VLEHWHTGAMTRNASVLNRLAPQVRLSLHTSDALALGVQDGAWVDLHTRHGHVRARASVGTEVQVGQVFMPFAFWEAAANQLTGDALDPVAKIPGFKVTAARVVLATATTS
jgi:formate dehydrogenase major subunit